MLARQVANEACLSLLLVVEVGATVVTAVALTLPLDRVPVLLESPKMNENPGHLKILFMSFRQS